MGKLVLLVAGAAFAALPASSSAGAPVTAEFSGTVTLVQDETPILDGSVQVGTPFSGAFTYDSVGTDLTADPAIGTYVFTTPPAAFRLEVGNYVFEMPTDQPNLAIGVDNNAPDDRFSVGPFPPVMISGPLDPIYAGALPALTSMGFGLRVAAPGPLTSDGLPTAVPVVSDWTTRTIRVQASGSGAEPIFAIEGNVTTIVPEPSSASLLLASLAGLSWLARWRARPR
jgi:hypothetical protein